MSFLCTPGTSVIGYKETENVTKLVNSKKKKKNKKKQDRCETIRLKNIIEI